MSIIQIEVKDSQINDLLEGHSNGMAPWLHSIEGGNPHKGEVYKVTFDREEDEEGEGKGEKRLTWEDVKRGLGLFAIQCPELFAQWLRGDDDMCTFDAAWQSIIFGKQIYG